MVRIAPGCLDNSDAAAGVVFVDRAECEVVREVGHGIGCPIVVAGRVFTSAMVDDKTVGLYAFDAASGDPLWMCLLARR